MAVHAHSWNGLDAWFLADDRLEAIVLPTHGGKIISLIDVATGRDWLWKNPHLPLKLPSLDRGDQATAFVREYDTGGFDECFPAVSEGPYPSAPWHDRRIPDHGVLWAADWHAEKEADTLVMVARMRQFPMRFERRISLRDGRLRIDYQASNPTDHPFPFIWSAHPLLALEEGMRIDLPVGHGMEVYGSDRLGDRHTPVIWPHASGLDLSRVANRGYSAKLAGSAPSRGWVALALRDRSLRIAYDPHDVTDLGLWLNMGGWSPHSDFAPYFNLGLEPCIGWGDDLAYAVSHGLSHGTLPPRGERRWWLELNFETGG